MAIMTYQCRVDFAVIFGLVVEVFGWNLHNGGLVTHSWSVSGLVSRGVMQNCFLDLCTSIPLSAMSSYHIKVLFMVLTANVWVIGAMLLAFYDIYKGYRLQEQNKFIPWICGALSILGCAFIVIGDVFWVGKIHRDLRLSNRNFKLDYSFIMTAVAAFLYLLSGLLFLSSQREDSPKPLRQRIIA
ncbi:unnamed protein product [Lymnaea stagnalis]|uniref:Uncharacterized protein n=1 Tax=Lymnaea stagnalis TaxID=6523 RepID=A0AAV2HZW9_LYMST